jgi:hypothetical protein
MKRHRKDAKDIVTAAISDANDRSAHARMDASDGYRTRDFTTDREMLRAFGVTGTPDPDKPRPAPPEADWITFEGVYG